MSFLPVEIGAGVTFRAAIELPTYLAPEWDLKLILRGPGQIDLDSVDDGTGHVFEVAAAVTANWAPGRYRYELRATDGTDVVPVERGEVVIAPDLSAQAAGYDGRDHVRRVLDAIEAVIENRATMDQQSYQINNRSLSRTPLGDLIRLRAKYRAELEAQKRAKKGRGLGRTYKVRFS